MHNQENNNLKLAISSFQIYQQAAKGMNRKEKELNTRVLNENVAIGIEVVIPFYCSNIKHFCYPIMHKLRTKQRLMLQRNLKQYTNLNSSVAIQIVISKQMLLK